MELLSDWPGDLEVSVTWVTDRLLGMTEGVKSDWSFFISWSLFGLGSFDLDAFLSDFSLLVDDGEEGGLIGRFIMKLLSRLGLIGSSLRPVKV